MISIKQLIKAVGFPEENENQLLEKADSFSLEKKFEVEEACWALISTEYQNKLRFETQKAMLESATKGTPYTFDPKKLEDELLRELAGKLSEGETEEKIDEVREKLNELINKPTT